MAMDAIGGNGLHLWRSQAIDFSACVPLHAISSSLLHNGSGHARGLDDHAGLGGQPNNSVAPSTTSSAPAAASCDTQRKRPREAGMNKNIHVVSKQLKREISSGDERHEQFLERNRIAANKCRENKKRKTKHLEEQARVLKTQRHVMVNYINQIRWELLELKYKCLAHTECDCTQLRQYLGNTIARYYPAESPLDQRSNLHTQELQTISHLELSSAADLIPGSSNLSSAENLSPDSNKGTQLDFAKLDSTVDAILLRRDPSSRHDGAPTRSLFPVDFSVFLNMEL
jgi:hypothetical protein